MLDLNVPSDDESQQGRLNSTDRQDALIADLATLQGKGPGHIDAIEPICPRAGQRRGGQRRELSIIAQLPQGTDDGAGIEIVNQATLNRRAFGALNTQVIDDLVNQ